MKTNRPLFLKDDPLFMKADWIGDALMDTVRDIAITNAIAYQPTPPFHGSEFLLLPEGQPLDHQHACLECSITWGCNQHQCIGDCATLCCSCRQRRAAALAAAVGVGRG